MAFVARTTRESNRVGMPGSSTSEKLGPGSYYVPSKTMKSARPSFGPFASTSARLGSAHVTMTPGPGAYRVEAERIILRKADPSSVRLTPRRSDSREWRRERALGPGAYPNTKYWIKPQNTVQVPNDGRSESTNDGNDKVTWARHPTAPSIPSLHQSFGYKEKNGKLVMQKPPKSVVRSDPIGPGEYYKSSALQKNARKGTVDFARSRTQRTDFTASKSDVPGPGKYDFVSADSARTKSERQPPSMSFASKTKRGLDSMLKTRIRPRPRYLFMQRFLHKGSWFVLH